MKFSIEKDEVTAVKADLLVVNMHDGKVDNHSFAHRLDQKMDGLITHLVKKEKFEGKAGQSKLIYTHGKLGAEYVLLVGLGDKKDFDLETSRRAAAKAVQIARQVRADRVVTAAHGGHLGVFSKGDCTQAVVEGMGLASYRFLRYKKEEPDFHPIKEISILCPDPKKIKEVERGIERGSLVCEGVMLARDLINTPALDMTPLAMAAEAKKLQGIQTRIFDANQIKKMNMGAFWGVAMGSHNPPVFIEMHYKPRGKIKKKVALVGKGVTFDSGGLSLKPPKSMETMKDDMSGAASVLGLMSVIARLAPQVEVWGFVAAAENMPGGHAQRPGDVVKAMNGKTIEVLNTDAEGRLTLADALCYAVGKKPDFLVDAATLTGACLVALGDRYAGVMGNDQKLVDKLIACGKKTGEKMWQLPLASEYKEELKSPIADLKNVGGNYGGTINGGLFIQEFVGNSKWAHLDIAGPSWTEKPREYESRGGTGFLVRTFAEFLLNL